MAPIRSGSERAATDVLNGIAYDESKDRLFVTGKLWPKLVEIKVVTKAGQGAGKEGRGDR